MRRSVTGVFIPGGEVAEPPGVTEPLVTEPSLSLCVFLVLNFLAAPSHVT